MFSVCVLGWVGKTAAVMPVPHRHVVPICLHGDNNALDLAEAVTQVSLLVYPLQFIRFCGNILGEHGKILFLIRFSFTHLS